IQFTLNLQLAAAAKGNSIWIKVQHIDALYKFHQQKKAEIVAPLKNQPWGMADYTVRDINGYYIHFAAPATDREKSEGVLPLTIRITGRKPTVQEYRELEIAMGGSSLEKEEMTEKRLNAIVFASVAEDTASGKLVGCALLLGDNASFYYVKDVWVIPDWQGKRVGFALMQEINNWLEKNAANKSLVALICSETLEPFYQQFGFTPAFSMIKNILRDYNQV
ncbi:MAG: GNAT family N-acetyltransferase, partial [Chitinophagaceae bacterium]